MINTATHVQTENRQSHSPAARSLNISWSRWMCLLTCRFKSCQVRSYFVHWWTSQNQLSWWDWGRMGSIASKRQDKAISDSHFTLIFHNESGCQVGMQQMYSWLGFWGCLMWIWICQWKQFTGVLLQKSRVICCLILLNSFWEQLRLFATNVSWKGTSVIISKQIWERTVKMEAAEPEISSDIS